MLPDALGLRGVDETSAQDKPPPSAHGPVATPGQTVRPRALKILILEDNPNDAELITRELRSAGLDFIEQRVASRADFVAALETFAPDILLADYKLPDFNGGEALAHVRQAHPEIPVVMVTGTLGEEAAVELLKAGAKDYVLKSSLLRLPSAVERAIALERGIHARKAAERAVRQSEEKFRAFTAAAPNGIVVINASSTISYWNTAAERIFGYTTAEALGRKIHQWLVPVRFRAAAEAGFREFAKTGRGPVIGKTVELAALRKDGVEIPIELSLNRLRVDAEWHAVGILNDITERKKSETALKTSNALLQTAERIAHIGGFEWDIASGQVVWSEELYRIFGQSPGQFVPTRANFIECVHPDDRGPVQEAIDASVTRNRPFDIEFRIVRPDKSERIIHSRGEVIRDENGLPIRMTGTSDDITGRREAAAALALSEERHRTLVLATSQVVWTTDAQGKALDDSPGWRALTGLTIEAIKGDGWAAALHPDDLKPTMDVWSRAVGTRTLYDTEFRVRRYDGTYRHMAARGVPVLKEDGTVREWIGTCTDITERKEAERALQRLNRTLRTLSRGNEALVRAASEAELLNDMCRVIVETGGYRMVWVGVPQQDAAKSVTPVARAGIGAEFFEDLPLHSWSGESEGGCVCGHALNSGQAQTSQDLLKDPAMTPWRARFARHGIGACAAFPLRDSTDGFAVLTIYAAEADAFDTDELKLLQELANDLAFGIRSLREHTAHEALEKRWRASLEATIGAIASTVETRDPYTAGHQQRVARLAVAMARELHLPEEQIEGLYLAGIVHDVGKIDIPSDILNKPGKLSRLQYQLIQGHAEAGYAIVKGVDFPWPIAEMVRQHHERLDGSGYPQGLKAEAILPEARILAVADVVEAMMSHRPYRASLGIEAALAEIEKGKGKIFDAAAVEACTVLFRQNGFSFE